MAFENVIPILKPGRDPSDPKCYGSICLLNVQSKILERLLLIENILMNNLSHQLLRVTRQIASRLVAKFPTGMLLLDVEKAFNCVWQDALLHKLLEYRFQWCL
jgi:hypothetical protein